MLIQRSVARSIWMKNGRNHTNNEAVSTEGCRRLKAAGKASRCFIYHNMELVRWATLEYLVHHVLALGQPSPNGVSCIMCLQFSVINFPHASHLSHFSRVQRFPAVYYTHAARLAAYLALLRCVLHCVLHCDTGVGVGRVATQGHVRSGNSRLLLAVH